nr:MAG: ORF1 [TTV-like mini virus]UGV37061.1 MAG: ORF1 [TTV-like mini virus]UGV37631.1 MAG: ORF1 [TTV-like mini virus]UGV39235.1 MAG: ORF1 [TTV-like mini virus]UGV42225.1 MAG: ORF1 [TTV-like mini virus]
MPYYNRYRYQRRRWRPRRYWRRRFRRPFQRRFWRRRYWVRHKKLKKLKLTQWQPHYIRKAKIRGIYPLVLTTRDRLSNNLNSYLDSTAPYLVPGGGGFSICNWSLYTLYRENLQLRNWWTYSNDNLPLVRYLGCKITLFRQADLDYMFYYRNSYPMDATITTYQSTCPQVMFLNNKVKIMACKNKNRNKKPYKKFFIKPPSQLQNKWYFQSDLAQTPLLQTITTCCSLDRMYLNSQSVSTTIGFVSLDTLGFKQHFFKDNTTSPYQPQNGQIIIACPNAPIPLDISKINIKNCILLGNRKDYTPGTVINSVPETTQSTATSAASKKLYTAYTNLKYWGNPFYADYFYGDTIIAMSNKTIQELLQHFNTKETLDDKFTIKTQKYIHARYNPFNDRGTGNILYMLPINEHLHSDDWGPPTDKDVVCTDLPLNIMLWGYLDFHRKAGAETSIDTTRILVFKSPYIVPKNIITFWVPLDEPFLHGYSQYTDPHHLIPTDEQNWHPKIKFQTQTVNTIASTAIGTTKLPPNTSTECHMRYCFYFKFGGEPPPMSILKNPEDQPKFPIPNNLLEKPSLQNPTTPFEQYLYAFDERRGQLTTKATDRITKDKQSEKDILSIAETSTYCPATYRKHQETPETTSSEEDQETTPEERLLQQRRKQRHLKKLINRLLLKLTSLE